MEARIRALSDRAEFWLIITLCFAYYVATSLTALLLRVTTLELTTGRALRGIATEVALLAIAAWILKIRGFDFSRLTRRPTWLSILAGAPLVVGYLALYWGASIAVALAFPAAARFATIRMIPTAPFALIAILILVNSVFEEVAVTGYVVSKLAPDGPALAIAASTLLRLLYHLYQGPVALLSIIPLGVLFAAVYWRTRTLWPLLVAHTLANFLAFSMATGN
jgi:membrane protease YdiL (CAAX protease family)